MKTFFPAIDSCYDDRTVMGQCSLYHGIFYTDKMVSLY